MKTAIRKTGLVFRFGVLAAALLLGQQALAAGTRANTTIENTASVDYFVNSIDQTDVTSNTVSFVVDRRVDYTLVPVSTPDLLPVTPGQDDVFVDFLLTNTSNDDLDFTLVLAQVTTGTDVDGSGNDDADISNIEYAVSAQTVAGGDADPVQGGPQLIDDLPADAAIRIRVWGDAALTMTDGQIAGVELTSTALDSAGAALAYGVANDDGLQNVDVNGNDGVASDNDGFIVQSASLTVVKSVSIIDGDLGTGLLLPGVRLQYDIVVTNAAGGADADNVSITDTIDPDLTFLTGAGGSDFSDIEYSINGAAFVACTADVAAGDTDGCSLDGNSLVVGNANLAVTIAATETFAIRFQALLPDPATTP